MWNKRVALFIAFTAFEVVLTHPQYPSNQGYQTTVPSPPQQNIYDSQTPGGSQNFPPHEPIQPEVFGHSGGPGAEIVFQEEKPPKLAVAVVKGPGNSPIQGVINFQQKYPTEPVVVSGYVEGLSPGWHGFHIHEYGDVSENCKAAGGHFNPHNVNHGSPNDYERHVGDLGNIAAPPPSQYGFPEITEIYRQDKVISLFDNKNNIVGRTVVIHSGEDDLGSRKGNAESLRTGNAGSRVACGVIFLREYHSG